MREEVLYEFLGLMKILFVTSTLTSGGAERVISLLANKFADRGNEVEMIALTSISPDFYQLNKEVRFIHADKECGGGLLKELRWFRRHVKQEGPDVVVAFMEAVYEFVLLALQGCGIPVISSERKDPATLGMLRKFLRWLLLPTQTCAAHVVQTKKIKRYYSRHVQAKTAIIYNPVNAKVYGFPLGNKVLHCQERIVSVGRLYPQKNQKMMIEAFSRIKDKYPNYQLVIYGEGHLRGELERLITKLQLVDRVLLPGRSTTVIEEVAKSKVFCLSSNFEGMSNAMIEAMCVGTPVISTKVSGTDELIKDGENGLLVDINDVDGLARAFDSLLGNEKLQVKFAHQGVKWAPQFKLDRIVDEWEKLMNQVTSRS